jgi:UPF0755 protein
LLSRRIPCLRPCCFLPPLRRNPILLRPGSSARTIATELRNAGVIRSRYAFLALHYFRVRPLKAGEYLFDHPANAFEVYDRLARGDIATHTVVVPKVSICGTLPPFSKLPASPAAPIFWTLPQRPHHDQRSRPGGAVTRRLSFPDTYHFTRTQSLTDMLTVMTKHFRQEAKAIGLESDFHRVVTMASIVEKETGAPEERPLVAGVYYNRLGKRDVARRRSDRRLRRAAREPLQRSHSPVRPRLHLALQHVPRRRTSSRSHRESRPRIA